MSDICPCNTWSSALTVEGQTHTSPKKTKKTPKLQDAVWNFNDGGNNMQRLLMVKFQEGGMGLKLPLRSRLVNSWLSDRASEGFFCVHPRHVLDSGKSCCCQQTCVPLCPLGKPKNSTAPLTIGWPGSPGKPTSPWTA